MTQEDLYNGHGWRLALEETTLPDGRMRKAVRAYRCGTVHILAFPSPDEILILHEYRPFYKAHLWMIPSGHIDKETDPDTAAQRELQEETGMRARSLERYCETNHSEALVFSNYLYIARDLVPDPLPQDESETIEVHRMPLKEAIDKVLTSPVVHTASAYGLLRYAYEHP